MKSLGPYDVSVSVRERLFDRAAPFVVLHVSKGVELQEAFELTPAFARTMARHLKQYADMADPPKKRPSKP